jgi:hypothetical protein
VRRAADPAGDDGARRAGLSRLFLRLILCGMFVAPPAAAAFLVLALAATGIAREHDLREGAEALRLLLPALIASVVFGSIPGGVVAAVVALVRVRVGPLAPAAAVAVAFVTALPVAALLGGTSDVLAVGPASVALLAASVAVVAARRRLGIAALCAPLASGAG